MAWLLFTHGLFLEALGKIEVSKRLTKDPTSQKDVEHPNTSNDVFFYKLSYRTVTLQLIPRWFSLSRPWSSVYSQHYGQLDTSYQANKFSKWNSQLLQYSEKLSKYLIFLTVIQVVTGLLLQWTGSEKPWRQKIPAEGLFTVFALNNLK